MFYGGILLVILVVAISALIAITNGKQRYAQVEELLRGLGYKVLEIKQISEDLYHVRVTKAHLQGTFTAIVLFATTTHDYEMLQFGRRRDDLSIRRPRLEGFIGPDPRRTNAQIEADEQLAIQKREAEQRPLTLEEQINQEVSRRLDQLTNTPNGLLSFDLNQNGQIDPQEWELLRAQIRAEVEADMNIQPDQPQAW